MKDYHEFGMARFAHSLELLASSFVVDGVAPPIPHLSSFARWLADKTLFRAACHLLRNYLNFMSRINKLNKFPPNLHFVHNFDKPSHSLFDSMELHLYKPV
jgi:hypothetical protein